MTVKVGDEYRNTSGVILYGMIPPDAVVSVRQVDPDDEDAAHAGTVVVEWDPDPDGDNAVMHKFAAGLTADELGRDFTAEKKGKGD